ncbi:MAG: DUF285 domain-containing protein [Candidatus Woesearchaeota archaeon]|nr:MAG: DUF285 domain-containing protein [Candidatus Woesearchaeota archaeon]
MKKGVSDITALFFVLTLVIVIGGSAAIWLTYIHGKPSVEAYTLQGRILTSAKSDIEILSGTYFNGTLYLDMRNTGPTTVSLDESDLVLAIEDMNLQAVCAADTLTAGGNFEADITKDLLNSMDTERLVIHVNESKCKIFRDLDYKYTLLFSSKTSVSGHFTPASHYDTGENGNGGGGTPANQYFKFQIQTSSDNETFSFQTSNAVNLFVDWGDNTNNTYSGSGLRNHVYAAAGIYNVSLNGTASRISFYEGTEDLLIDVLTNMSDGLTGITSAYRMFESTANFGTSPLTEPAFFDKISENVTTMALMFYGSQFNQPIGNWDVSSVTDMTDMFRGSQFNQPIGNWDVSSVTSMQGIFHSSQFNQPIGNWDVSSVTSMSSMFYLSPFNKSISNWNTSNVISMNVMFYGSQFNQPIGNWDVSSVTSMVGTFWNTPFDQNISSWDVSSVTDMTGMLDNAPMSTDNYDDLIIGWNSLPSLQNGVTFGVQNLEYCFGEEARQNITNDYGWTFSGDSKNCV